MVGFKKLPEEDRVTARTVLDLHQPFRSLRGTMPLQYVTAFMLVAEEEGLGVVDYAQRAGVSISVMSRHLLDIGDRDRHMGKALASSPIVTILWSDGSMNTS